VSTRAVRRNRKPVNVWTRPAAPLRLGDERLRFDVLKGDGSTVTLDDVLTSVRWDDVAMELTGAVTATVPIGQLRLNDGDRLRAFFAPSATAAFSRLWTLTIGADDQGVTRGPLDDSLSTNLTSSLARYRGTRMDFHFRRDKSHPKGWTCDQIARAVCRKAGIPVGRLTKGTHYIRNLVRRNADPVDVVLIAYRQEREATGRRFFASWNGRWHITPLTRSRELVELLPVLTDASYTVKRRTDLATILNVRASVKRGKRTRRKVRVRVVDAAGVRQYGAIAKTVSPANVDTEEEARDYARKSLTRRLTLARELQVTVPLMPRIKRGDAMMARWPDSGLQQVVFVRSASHEWTPGGGTTTITARFDDPFVDKRAKKNNKTKAKKAKVNGRAQPKGAARSAPPRPKRGARRSRAQKARR
jgi:hypothetical protein